MPGLTASAAASPVAGPSPSCSGPAQPASSCRPAHPGLSLLQPHCPHLHRGWLWVRHWHICTEHLCGTQCKALCTALRSWSLRSRLPSKHRKQAKTVGIGTRSIKAHGTQAQPETPVAACFPTSRFPGLLGSLAGHPVQEEDIGIQGTPMLGRSQLSISALPTCQQGANRGIEHRQVGAKAVYQALPGHRGQTWKAPASRLWMPGRYLKLRVPGTQETHLTRL